MICIICGKATRPADFFPSFTGRKNYIHLHCMASEGLNEGQKAIVSGIFDDIGAAMRRQRGNSGGDHD